MYRMPQQSYLPSVRQPYTQSTKPRATKPQSNTMMIVFVVGLFVLIGGAVAYYFLSKKYESQGTNIIPNGDFSKSTGWTPTGNWTIPGGKATCNGTGVLTLTPKLSQYKGKTVKVEFDIVDFTSGSVYVGSGLGPGPRDGIMVGIAKLGPSIRATRIGIDFTAFVVGVLLGGSYGLGTIFMVVTVGPIVQYSLKRFNRGAIFSL